MIVLPAGQRLAWGASLPRTDIEFCIDRGARDEVLRFVAAAAERPLESVSWDDGALPLLRREIECCRGWMDAGARMAIIRPVEGLSLHGRRVFAWAVANLFGEPLVQNAEGDRVIAVYARPGNRRVIDGARYHQSREGGGPHTDNVSLPDAWEYLVFSCIRPATIGGESILIDGLAVHRELQRVPQALRVLERPFWWEYRGIAEGVFEAPIVTYHDGQPHFRYLRKYLESAHRRAGTPLTDEQVWALDVLEALVDRTDLQFRTRLEGGEILVTIDSQVLHARTAFADATPGGPRDAAEALRAGGWRFFDRVWARKRS